MRIARCWMLVAAVTLSGCGVQNLWSDETERFEEAQPLPAAIVQAKAKLDALDNAVMRQTGQRIGGFQGRYSGKPFMVSGR